MVQSKTFRQWLFVILVLLFFGAPAAATDIVIGTSAAFRGPSKGLGIELYRGAKAYFEYINEYGGIHGNPIVMKEYDDGYDPTPAIENTIRLIERDHVLLLMNYVGTPTVTRVLPLLKQYESSDTFLFFPFTGAQPQREAPYDAFVYNLRASYRQETAGLVNRFVAVGRRRIAVFYQADSYGRSGWDGVRRALAKLDQKIAGEATYRRGAKFTDSMAQQVAILQQAAPDAVIAVGSYAACAAFIRDARDGGMKVPIADLSFVGSENLLALLQEAGKARGKDYTGNLINSQVVPSYEDTSLPAVKQYREIMTYYNPEPPSPIAEAGYKPLPFSFVSFEGFLNAKLLVEVLKRMPSIDDKQQIRKTMEGIKDLDIGIDAKVTFGPGRNQGLDAVYYTTVKDGKFVPVKDWEGWRK
jgi:branched-chain amino acid transport system substrate-binding protein